MPPAPAYYPVAAVYGWGGGYVGINGGYAFGQSEWSDPFNPSGTSSSGHFNVNGGLVGVTMGVSGQWGGWVFGVEGDFDWQGLSGSSNSAFCTSIFLSPAALSPAGGLSCKTQSNWIGRCERAPAMRGIACSSTAPSAAPARMWKWR